jgi:hypothetical protein
MTTLRKIINIISFLHFYLLENVKYNVYVKILASHELDMPKFLCHDKPHAIKYTLHPQGYRNTRLATIKPQWHLFAFPVTEEQ